eukprot:TRINITY_DN28513_c0_g1_i1.p1 TRINITY_DN28513_c0_g1~~TRINITY_DN28513_c0_g1_i1.p1  ORF type:complete len:544 (+),score=107.31 TRINITY_DN28513_c0_g1_i1:223-1632(+)
MFADWLQGPYVYALYESYGISPGDNAVLFVVGFGSSMIFGTIVGSLADRTGRRRAALVYCLSYVIHNVTKHVNSYGVLMIGRLMGGISTSILFSVFDSWLVCEHSIRGFDPDLLAETFSLAVFGNSLMAILAGVVAQFAADWKELTPLGGALHIGGYCSPFDVSIGMLCVCAVMLRVLWSENYGGTGDDDDDAASRAGADASVENSSGNAARAIANGGSAGSVFAAAAEEANRQLATLRGGFVTVMMDSGIFYCGLVCACFEAAMFIFIFQWTPALTEADAPEPPYGFIFATFMVPCMLGSQVFTSASRVLSVERIGQAVLALAFASHLVPAVSSDATSNFLAFLVFELSVGIYFPLMGTLKSQIVPESARATIYNLYRVPMNFMVLLMLGTKSGPRSSFALTSAMLAAGLAAMGRLQALRPQAKAAAGFELMDVRSPTNKARVQLEASESSVELSAQKVGRSSAQDIS